MAKKRVLIIDDEENMRHSLSLILEREGYEAIMSDSAKDALQKLETDELDFILCDIRMPGMDGMEFLKKIHMENRSAPTIIMMSAYGSVDIAIQAMRHGAYDYISKPFKSEEIILTLKKAEERENLKNENRLLKRQIYKEYNFADITAKSKNMLDIFKTIKKVAGFKTTVLLVGESGTGKELISRAIYSSSDRADKPFIAVNCGAIPENLLESEFFGYVKGAFTDAKGNKKGLFEEADGGTLFLDEIGELPPQLQVKLLRVLQEEEIRKLGANKSIRVDVRIIAATVKDLPKEVREGNFREDLFYRLNVMCIAIPPLRDRREDIPLLIKHFIDINNKRLYKSVKGVSDNALNKLMSYRWKGNIRELENIIERGMILTNTDIIDDINLPSDMETENYTNMAGEQKELSIKNVFKKVEKELILTALKKAGSNKVKTAKLLDISYRALMYKLKEYDIE